MSMLSFIVATYLLVGLTAAVNACYLGYLRRKKQRLEAAFLRGEFEHIIQGYGLAPHMVQKTLAISLVIHVGLKVILPWPLFITYLIVRFWHWYRLPFDARVFALRWMQRVGF